MRATMPLVSVVVAACALVAGCLGPAPASPVAAIPKLMVDVANGVTTITITSVNADVRYANITVILENANLSAPLVFHESKGYALVAHTNLSFFELNATADESAKTYEYKATFHVVPTGALDPEGDPLYQTYIREPPDQTSRTESIPFRHILAEKAR